MLWGSFFRIFGRMLLVAPREKLTLALILKVQDKRPQRLFYYHQTGFVLQPLRVPFVFGGVLKQKLFFGCIFDPVSEFQLFFFIAAVKVLLKKNVFRVFSDCKQQTQHDKRQSRFLGP